MKFEARTQDLKVFLQGVTRISKKNQTRPGLEGVRLVLEGTTLRATARDDHNFITSQLTVDGKEDGSVVVSDGQLLASIIGKATQDTLTLSWDGKGDLLIRDGRAQVRIRVTFEDVIGSPDADEPEVRWTLPQKVLRRMLQTTAFAAGNAQSHAHLMGVRFQALKGELWAVATNASILSYMKVKGDFAEGAFTLPSNMVPHVLTWIHEDDEPVTLEIGDSVRIIVGNTVIVTRPLNGTFPDFFRVVNVPFEYKAEVNREQFQAALERARLMDQCVQLRFESGRIAISSVSADLGTFSGEVDAEGCGPGPEQYYNADYLLSALRNARSEKVAVYVNKGLLPGSIESDDFTLLIMPIRKC